MNNYVGKVVRFRGGRIRYRIIAIDGHMVTLIRLDGRDDGNATTVADFNIERLR